MLGWKRSRSSLASASMGCCGSKKKGSCEKVTIDKTEQDEAARKVEEARRKAEEAKARAEAAYEAPVAYVQPPVGK